MKNNNKGPDTRPHELSREEWREVMSVPVVRESWGLEEDATPESFAGQVYAAKFKFVSGSPGYVGDLYIIQGDVLTGDAPLVFTRDKNSRLALQE